MLIATSNSHGGQQCRLEPDDDGLRIAALKLLQSSSYTTLRRLRCEVTDAVVIVHGILPSYYLKQIAQTIVLRLEGIEGVVNLVEVRGTDSRPCCENEDEAPEVEFAVETRLLTQPITNLPQNLLAVENQR
jgi:BON domain